MGEIKEEFKQIQTSKGIERVCIVSYKNLSYSCSNSNEVNQAKGLIQTKFKEDFLK